MEVELEDRNMKRRFLQNTALPRISHEEMRTICDNWDKHFDQMSEEDQILSIWAPKISMSYGLSDHNKNRTKEDVARHVLKDTFGPKFTERVLNDPECRKKLGIDA